MTAALAIVELDGIARRIVLCPADLVAENLLSIVATAQTDVLVSDHDLPRAGQYCFEIYSSCSKRLKRLRCDRKVWQQTEWILPTSGTTSAPKLVIHTLSTLIGAIKASSGPVDSVVWSTFYDIRRYGGLQIFLRAMLGGRPLVLSDVDESSSEFLARAGAEGVTHISGTPSHWRRALMSPSVTSISPRYVRLSGEIADQAILDRLQVTFPAAKIVHAFASTEAGVAFEVHDGYEGFPSTLVGAARKEVDLKVEQGSLRVRSPRNAVAYLGTPEATIKDADGFVDTRDIVELCGERYYFAGRMDSVINVGGLKVHPEEIEAVINRHPSVLMSVVKARKNPIIGSLVVADVVPRSEPNRKIEMSHSSELRASIIDACRRELAPYKVPAVLRFVEFLSIGQSGKLRRANEHA
jgi:acyl-coenzyme A synthetase/AMP-(fatty) acid ligase